MLLLTSYKLLKSLRGGKRTLLLVKMSILWTYRRMWQQKLPIKRTFKGKRWPKQLMEFWKRKERASHRLSGELMGLKNLKSERGEGSKLRSSSIRDKVTWILSGGENKADQSTARCHLKKGWKESISNKNFKTCLIRIKTRFWWCKDKMEEFTLFKQGISLELSLLVKMNLKISKIWIWIILLSITRMVKTIIRVKILHLNRLRETLWKVRRARHSDSPAMWRNIDVRKMERKSQDSKTSLCLTLDHQQSRSKIETTGDGAQTVTTSNRCRGKKYLIRTLNNQRSSTREITLSKAVLPPARSFMRTHPPNTNHN